MGGGQVTPDCYSISGRKVAMAIIMITPGDRRES